MQRVFEHQEGKRSFLCFEKVARLATVDSHSALSIDFQDLLQQAVSACTFIVTDFCKPTWLPKNCNATHIVKQHDFRLASFLFTKDFATNVITSKLHRSTVNAFVSVIMLSQPVYLDTFGYNRHL